MIFFGYCTYVLYFFFIKINVFALFALSGLQVLLPDYLQERFVQAALSYIACNSEGEFICKDNDCWCQCGPKFPECNCPSMDIQAMEENLLRTTETWKAYNMDFEESGKTYFALTFFKLGQKKKKTCYIQKTILLFWKKLLHTWRNFIQLISIILSNWHMYSFYYWLFSILLKTYVVPCVLPHTVGTRI